MKIFKNKLIVGVICIVTAILISFVLAPLSELFTSRNITVLRASAVIHEGDVITNDLLESVSVGKFNLPTGTQSIPADVSGLFATCDIQPGDYITSAKLSDVAPVENAYLLNLPDGKVAISIELSTSAAALSGKLRADDIVSIFASAPPNMTAAQDQTVTELYAATLLQSYSLSPDELKYVKILAVSNEAEKDIESEQAEIAIDLNNQQAISNSIQTVTLEVNRTQASLLAGLNGNNKLHCALVSRGDAEKSESLLEKQNEIFTD